MRKNSPCDAGDTSSVSGLGGPHMLQATKPKPMHHVSQLLKPTRLEGQQEKPPPREATTGESPRLAMETHNSQKINR